MPKITPRTLKGFRDYLPEIMIPRCKLIETASRVYRSYGFSPIDTPCLEYLEILTGKGSDETDKQLYHFQDHGGRDVGLRFDLTVPLARFVAQHINELGVPFKRYHIAPVWRGENTQAGRYREFMQCDFDTIGTLDISADIESTLVIHDLMRAIGFERFTININNRKVLSGLLEKLDLADRTIPVLRALDKLAKIGKNGVLKELVELVCISEEKANEVLRLADINGTNEEILSSLAQIAQGSALAQQGVGELEKIIRTTSATGVKEENLRINVSIARGLDYYTGTIWETFLGDLPKLGSVCSGGRFDNLAELFTSQKLPGIGASLGLDRLLAGMEELGMIPPVRTPATVFIPFFDENRLADYCKIADSLRKSGLNVEVYPESKKLGFQLKYADKRGFEFAVIAGENEFNSGICQVKNLKTQTKEEVPFDQLAEKLR